MPTPVKVLVPSGVLGSGCPEDAFQRGVSLGPDALAVDGGSTDSGPYYLGAAVSKMTDAATKQDLRQLMLARDRLGVPLIVGSCGTSGTNAGVDWMAGLCEQIAVEEGLTAKVTLVYSEQTAAGLAPYLANGAITPLPPMGDLAQSRLDECDHIVGLLGYEPLAKAIAEGADIVLAGRTTDTAVIAAVPLMRGLPAGASWHAAKTSECGGLCTVHTRRGGVILTIDDEGFDIEPLAADNACTPFTISAHLLYENADPYRLTEPGVVLDAQGASYAALDARSVRVTGSRAEARPYTMKLEGSGAAGFRTMVFTAIADPKIMDRIGDWLDRLETFLREGIDRVLRIPAVDYRLDLRPYGWNALDPRHGPTDRPPLEVGLMVLVTAATQARATEIAKYCNPYLLHFPLNQDDPLPSFAFPFSPAEVALGPQYEFKLNHVVHLADPCELATTRTFVAGLGEFHVAA
ncbi:acyclic terpene utilization AtuA family protein [Caulobacter sp. SLTY]|uniref:acyclic terpene utilization AtuA family protein n=1 Tax=Caulobacter sp. SLTY TaxID=2683262 RepID=UPI001412A932|nr:acyclic terpene utilization AtuA family protein [Caulobacter sp. SLTY]NBB14778.1 acyclic terpene utilization AtuA family protein [Caulobacter sp. SLTY]